MAGILESLKPVSANKRKSLSPIQHRRNKLIDKIHEQINAGKARLSGEQHTIKRLRRIRNKETNETSEILKDCRIRESWWTGDNGHVYIELRYGVKPLEFAKGKNAIEVVNMEALIPTLEMLKQATEAGEFDDQLMTVGGRFEKKILTTKKQTK